MIYKKIKIAIIFNQREEFDGILRLNEDGSQTTIPNDSQNRDWQAYQEWLAQGNEPLEAAE